MGCCTDFSLLSFISDKHKLTHFRPSVVSTDRQELRKQDLRKTGTCAVQRGTLRVPKVRREIGGHRGVLGDRTFPVVSAKTLIDHFLVGVVARVHVWRGVIHLH